MRLRPPSLMLAAVLAVGLGACDTIPKPFRHDDGAVAALARPKLGRGIALRLDQRLDDPAPLAEAVIKAFEDREIPLTLRHGPGFGRVIEAEADGAAVKWRLRDADGSVLSGLTTLAAAPVKAAALRVAAQFHPWLEDPDALPQIPAQDMVAAPRVRLAPLRGLPGDGDQALARALAQALDRQRLTVADDAAYTVVGVVSVAPSGATEDTVTVSWLVKRGDAAGTQLARIDQGGAVPRGRLNLPWGSLARDIAEGGAASIVDVVRQDDRTRRDHENSTGSRQFTEPGSADIGKPDSTEQSNPAPTSQPAPVPAAPATTAATSEEPASAGSALPSKAAPAKPKPAKAVVKTKTSAKKTPSPAKTPKVKPPPRTKPHR